MNKTRLIFRVDGAGFGYTLFRVNSDSEIDPSPELSKALTWFPPGKAETRAEDHLCARRACVGDEYKASMNI